LETFFKIKEKLAKNLIRQGKVKKNNLFLVRKTSFDEFKVIISVRKKYFKKAVVRNKIKRIVRAIIRETIQERKGFVLIIVSNRLDLKRPYNEIKQKLLELI
jgi:ribonuclease P protein component